MTVHHEVSPDKLHTVTDITDTRHYTVHTEAGHQDTRDIRNHSYLLSSPTRQLATTSATSNGCKGGLYRAIGEAARTLNRSSAP